MRAMRERMEGVIRECYGHDGESTTKKIAKKVWEINGRFDGRSFENWKIAEWVHGNLDVVLDNCEHGTRRYTDDEKLLAEVVRNPLARLFCYPLCVRIAEHLESLREKESVKK